MAVTSIPAGHPHRLQYYSRGPAATWQITLQLQQADGVMRFSKPDFLREGSVPLLHIKTVRKLIN
jgi:hypothetical protein